MPRGLRAASSTDAAFPECGCGIEIGADVAPRDEDEPPTWFWLRALALELVRWCRRSPVVLGMGNPGPDIRCVSVKDDGCCDWSAVVDVLVEEALETTEEFCAARRIVRSRVRRFTWSG